MPTIESTKLLWENLYKSNINIDLEKEELNELLNKYNNIQTHRNEIIKDEEIKNSIKNVPNWKEPGPDMIQRYYLKYVK